MSNFKIICPAAKALMACCRRTNKQIRHVVCMKVFLVYFVSKEYTGTCSGPSVYCWAASRFGCFASWESYPLSHFLGGLKSRFNLSKPSGSTWCSICVECFVLISEQTATFVLYIINWLVFRTVVESVYSAVRTDSLYKADYV